jgi:hypothetical protein
MARYVRYRALVDTFYILGKYRVDMTAYNGSPTPLNLVTLSPVWSPVGTHVSLAVLSQIADRASPTTALLGLDSPQSSLSHTNRPYVTNPPVPGLYARWTTAISAADQADGSLNVVLSTSCKAIGGNFPDADADCTPDASEGGWCNDTGWPGYPATTVAGNPDSDDDGLLDGVEAAWGSNPCVGDTDGDGRTDTEEMVGPSQFLTNPKVMDSDGDGVDDGGLKLDLYDADTNWDGCQDSGTPDGRPDSPDEDGDGICDAGMSANYDFSGDGSSHRRVGFRIVGWDIQPDGAGQDNCPSIPNWDQVNFDLDTATTWGHGDLFGYECDTDDDNDGIVDSAELNFQYDQGAHQCANDPDLPGPATPLDPLNPDSDGDGVLDGVECEVGSNPADAGDSPGAPAADPDKDGVTNIHETFKRTQSFSNQPTGPVGDEDVDNDQTLAQCGGSESTCGQNDPDSDSDGLSDGCEVYVTGTNPLRPDSGGNGTPDAAEPNLAARIAAYCGSATDLDGDAVTNDVDNCLFVPNPAQTNTTPTIGNGKGIPGDDSTVPWSVTNDRRGDACDGDLDNDGLANASDTDPGGPALDNTYDDNNDGTWKGAGDDGPSWDTNMDAKLDGVAACAGSLGAWGGQDTDGDGLLNSWEFCKWGSSPNRVDSDGDTLGDCKEAADVDGDMVVDFVSDVVRYAKAILRSPASYGQDGDFDINGDANLSFASEVVQEAKFAFITGLCK